MQRAWHLEQGVGSLVQGVSPTTQVAEPPVAQGVGLVVQGVRPPAQGVRPPAQGGGPPGQGIGPLALTTIPKLDEAEPELGAELDGEAPNLDPQGDPRPEHPEDPSLKSCLCPKMSSYNDCMESKSYPAASSKRAAIEIAL